MAFTWVKIFRISPEFRMLRLPFYRKLASKMLNYAGYNNSFPDLVSVYLKVFDPYLEFLITWMYTASFKFWFFKVQNFSNFELSPMHCKHDINSIYLLIYLLYLYSNTSIARIPIARSVAYFESNLGYIWFRYHGYVLGRLMNYFDEFRSKHYALCALKNIYARLL